MSWPGLRGDVIVIPDDKMYAFDWLRAIVDKSVCAYKTCKRTITGHWLINKLGTLATKQQAVSSLTYDFPAKQPVCMGMYSTQVNK